MYRNIEEIKQANEAAGQYYFSPSTMRFFDSRILDGVYGGRYFVTSERGPSGIRAYSVRVVDEHGHIETVGDFQQYDTAAQAKRAARRLAAEK